MSKPVHVEDSGEIVGVPIKEIFWSFSRSELFTEGEDLVNGFSSHQLTKPRIKSFKIKWMFKLMLSVPDLVAGNTVRVSLAAMNLSPPTSRMTCFPPDLRLVMVRLGCGHWVPFI